MKLIIDIDDNVFTRLFDNGVDTSSDDREVIDRAVRNGKPYEERPQGKWFGRRYIIQNTGKYDVDMLVCSECGYEGSYDAETGISVRQTNFCPNCGADMRKETNND